MRPALAQRYLRIAAGLTLLALVLFLWSLIDPRPIPVILAMSAGQGIGTLSFLIYLFVLLRDLRKTRALADEKREARS